MSTPDGYHDLFGGRGSLHQGNTSDISRVHQRMFIRVFYIK